MPFTIDDPDVERLARELAAATGEPVPRALAAALRERLARVRPSPPDEGAMHPAATRPRLGSVAEIQAYLAALPELDARTPDEILGYGFRAHRRRGRPVLTAPDAPDHRARSHRGGRMPTRRAARETREPPDEPGPGRGVGPPAGLTEAALRAAVPEAIVVRGRDAGALVAACTCPYMDGEPAIEPEAWCKHVVAALFVELRDPAAVARQPTVPALVATLDRAALERLLDELVEHAPELYDVVADAVGRVTRLRRR